jgi:hypothetical protein
MPIWDGAKVVVLERSSDGQTAQVLGDGDAVLATCDDAGNVTAADGSTVLTAPFVWPHGSRSPTWKGRVDVNGPDGAAVGGIEMRRFAFGPFKKKLTLGLVDTGGTEVGQLMIADKKGRELTVTEGEAEVARLAQVDRDRSLARTVERWSLEVVSRPQPPADLLAAAAVLRYGKVLSELSSPARD